MWLLRADVVCRAARGAASGRHVTVRCRRCGGVVVETLETFPYIGPRVYLVELREVDTIRCAMCGVGEWHVPELQALDVLIRALATAQPHAIPQLTFKHDRWRIVVDPIDQSENTTWPRA
jgi:hypothetical protein